MKKLFPKAQIVYALTQAKADTPIAEVTRKLNISEQTLHRWQKLFAGMVINEARHVKQLEEENRRLKCLVAELTLDK